MKNNYELHQFSFHCHHEVLENATFGVGEKESDQVLLLQILGGDGSKL